MLLRIIKELGYYSYLILAIVLFLVYSFMQSPSYISVIVYFMITYLIHSYRNDVDFLKVTFGKKAVLMEMIDALLISIPFIMASAISGNYIYVAVILLAGIIICCLPHKQNKMTLTMPSLFRKGNYEYESGFRKMMPFYIIGLICEIIGCAVGNYNFTIVVLGVTSLLLPTNIYCIAIDSVQYLCYKNVASLLVMKMRNIVVDSLKIFVPLAIILLVSNFSLETSILLLKFYAAMLFIQTFMMLMRYITNGELFIMVISLVLFFLLVLIAIAYPLANLLIIIVLSVLFSITYSQLNEKI